MTLTPNDETALRNLRTWETAAQSGNGNIINHVPPRFFQFVSEIYTLPPLMFPLVAPFEMFLVAHLFILSMAKASRAITCGYEDGEPQSARTAQSGYGCRVDTANGLWGFCPTTVMSAKDCGLAGLCVDSHSCTEGCGRLSNRADITTFSCQRSQFCSTALLINGPDQSFEYIACGAEARTDKLFPVPNAVAATTTLLSSISMIRSSLTTPDSRPTATVVETSSVPASSSSTFVNSSFTSSTSDSMPASSKQEPTNIGPIVGGAVGGLTVICLTILGIVLIRRELGIKGQIMSPRGHNHGRNVFTEKALPFAMKNHQQISVHGPVEMYSGYHVNMEPVELSGQTHFREIPKTAE